MIPTSPTASPLRWSAWSRPAPPPARPAMPTLAAMLSVTAGSIAANAGDANNLAWTFSSTPEAFDYLDDGESLTLTYTVRATDDNGAFDDQTVTITITGTNDAPVITVGAGDSAAETLAETNAALSVSDTLTVDRRRPLRQRHRFGRRRGRDRHHHRPGPAMPRSRRCSASPPARSPPMPAMPTTWPGPSARPRRRSTISTTARA